MSDETQLPEMRIAVGHVSTLAKIFGFTATVSAGAVAAPATGIGRIGSFDVDIPLSFLWLLFVGVTVAHWYFAIAAKHSVEDVLQKEHDKGIPDEQLTGEVLFQEIRSQNTVFLRGLLARAPTPGGSLYRMSWRDPTTLIFIGLCALGFTAMLPWMYVGGDFVWTSGVAGVVASVAVGIALLLFNWAAGSSWTIALSQLRIPVTDAPNLAGRSVPLSGFIFDEFGCMVVNIIAALLLVGILWVIVTLV